MKKFFGELTLFQAVMWIITGFSLLAVVIVVIYDEIAIAPIHYLLLVAIAAASLSVVEKKVLPLLEKIKVGSYFEVSLASEAAVANRELQVPNAGPLELSENDAAGNGYAADQPFPAKTMTSAQFYHYERLSIRLYGLMAQIRDPNTLPLELRSDYRRLITNISSAALAAKHPTKARDISLQLNSFLDRPLNEQELSLLGRTHLWAATEVKDPQEKERLFSEAWSYLDKARRLSPTYPPTLYSLSWVSIVLRRYPLGITYAQRCARIDARVAPWCFWLVACAYAQQGNVDQTLAALEKISEGPWWGYISKDADFDSIRKNQGFREKFERMTAERTKGKELVSSV
jgi:tetratricopeptide (TPR) repeat protein